MNLPNKITISRIFLIPLFLILMMAPLPFGEVSTAGMDVPIAHLLGAALFIIASTTDWIDGYYARKYNMVTNLGKFLDPLADKLLVSAALIAIVDLDLIAGAGWAAIIIISREFGVTGLRLVLAGEGEVVAANMLGKIKTWTQIIAISAILLYNLPFEFVSFPFAAIALWISVVFTVISGWDYFAKNKQAFVNSK
ncbi:CDP-diacylglycerol--glycerol-3-phosphate 3-phosphatidyltransferase [Priestia flexa]|uniref:CDP-diacylglycerol--glycerol-3-phosphate 3-phosphatidyltransferase n=1 Tax=Priestia flexa TaxID=86664 RepID=A0A8I1MCM5_9BACI|nr:CDP-diacylglycerol--glycerol-3-phosphate 3-phosphatidyltransferase [Priestia flexa]MBN8250015.1 CDP-diacylglycerol--glycerol-3-phosphate 3-phosphatidyltransferase [Priestia flexa]MBN8434662.1 CDP-diacylglycerol--glycerol-3-phosphate 3-phosphatidyltransferase [Priestia flexa]MCA0967201.1 CDP-diacylglycerol--glycerol-3-phosphate 3-phosphatidyltransferase [Priestia flexa]RIV15842.1 CDP-diacylglycerol--glycerol-3-phosphate 3-phosphatidyltransferase [Priestia flexa]UZW67746.1 CDP-diacylglycerol-